MVSLKEVEAVFRVMERVVLVMVLNDQGCWNNELITFKSSIIIDVKWYSGGCGCSLLVYRAGPNRGQWIDGAVRVGSPKVISSLTGLRCDSPGE